jgi:hypothetical protein
MAIRYLSGINVDSNTLFVDSTNDRVGIGTSAPDTKLHVWNGDSGGAPYEATGITIENSGRAALNFLSGAGNDAYVFFGNSSAGNAGYVGYENTANKLVLRSSNHISLLDSTGEVIRVDNGNVGIGTTSPSNKLHIRQTGIVDNTATTLLLLDGQFQDGSIEEADMVSIGFRVENSAGGSQTSQAISFAYNNILSLMKDGGNVGIGTVSPISKLEISGPTGSYSSGIGFSATGTGARTYRTYIGTNGYFYFDDATGGSSRLTIDTSGNVGIGTTAPSEKLELSASGNIYGKIISTTTGGNAGVRFLSTGAREYGIFTDGDLRFYDFSASAERMRITSAGALLVGTTSTTNTASGKIVNRTTGSSNPDLALNGGAWSIASVGGEPALYLSSNIAAATGIPGATQTAKGGIGFEYVNAAAPTDIVLGIFGAPTVASSVRIFNNTERMRITSAGNVGIGTDNPSGKLHVDSGDIVLNNTYSLYLNSSISDGNWRVQRSSAPNITRSLVSGASLNLYSHFGTGEGFVIGANGGNSYYEILGSGPTHFFRGNVGIGTTTPDNVLDLGAASQGRALTWENYSNVFSAYSSGNLVLAQNFYGDTSTDTYKTSLTASYGAAGILISGTAAGLNGVMRFYVDNAAAKTAGAAFTPTERMQISGNGAIKFSTYGLGTFTGTPTYNLAVDASGNIIELPGGVVDGSGTANYVSKWSDANTLTDSVIYDDGTNVGIGTASPTQKLEVDGVIESPYLEFKPVVFYDFNSDTTGDWSKGNSTLSVPNDSVTRYTSTGADSNISKAFNFDGGQNQIIRIRYKVVTGPSGGGEIFYANSQHGYDASYFKSFTLVSDGAWHTLVLDMSSLNAGGTDWIDYNVTLIRFDLTNVSGVAIDIDWISIGGNGYGTQYFENDVAFMNGNVGIGTTAPAQKLHVDGAIRLTSNPSVTGDGSSAQFWDEAGVGPTIAGANFQVRTNGNTTALHINSSQNVGIGTTNPGAKLDVYRGLQTDTITRANAAAYIWGADVGLAIGQYSSGPYGTWLQSLKYDNNNSFPLSLNPSGGNVGIGTAEPDAIFHVAKAVSSGVGGQIVIDNPASSAVGNTAELSFLTDAGASGAGTRNAKILAVNTNAGNGAAELQFHTWNGAAELKRMNIAYNGVITFGAYGSGNVTGTPTYNLGVDASGNVIELPGGVVDGSGTAN